jgi:type IV pilus assembly protein PilX
MNPIRSQRGITMIMVMLLMTAMLMGVLAFARVTEVGTLVSNNLATKESSIHAAEVGRGVAFAQLQALATAGGLNNNAGGWYWSQEQPIDPATGIPTTINFNATPTVAGNVGRFTVTYAVERLCNVAAVQNSMVECVTVNKTDDDDETGDPPDMSSTPKGYMEDGAVQYRITVLVTEPMPRNTRTWTQTLVTVN